MQTQSPFAPLLGLPPQMMSSPNAAPPPSSTPVSLTAFPSAFAAFASQIRSTQLQSLLQSQIAALNNAAAAAAVASSTSTSTPTHRQSYTQSGKVRGTTEYPIRKRVGGSTVKTAKVWRYFDELPTIEQAAECRICRKKIKATNSSTTGMIRHLRSCHVQEYQVVQEARQSSMIVKMEEKARAKLLREMNEKVTNGIASQIKKEPSDSQKSPSASSSASDTASSASSSHYPMPPTGLPAPKPIKAMISIKSECTEVEEEQKPTDLSVKASEMSAFSNVATPEFKEQQKKLEEDHKIHMQIALMLLLDQQPPQLIDRPGFRSLFRFLLPEYQLPSGDIFQSMIVPQLLNHMKQQIGAIVSNTASFHQQQQQQQKYEENSSMNETTQLTKENYEEEEEDENVEVEDDTSSASSSMDADTCDAMASFINYIGNDVFPQDELISLLAVVSNIFAYFTSRPVLLNHLDMTQCPPTTPPLIQQIQFVSQNLTAISSYIRHTPDMQLLPLSVNQETMLQTLVDHIEKLQ
ncbi:unnamed protein product [Caenorhabditis bovis]|uniref:BED-type domain-containing protein n=1 Tax=Caenorhabditis bovis TaxID=2654633 RepID=A0A8S1EY33_9PELO|nr:unnamed protein product [Caenorhabditis bovis]